MTLRGRAGWPPEQGEGGCPHCGSGGQAAGARFCKDCGARLDQ